jgi:hypothetical protein
MCVITNENHIVISVSSLIGLRPFIGKWHIYPQVENPPSIGDTYKGTK